jgi:hypothetical protein
LSDIKILVSSDLHCGHALGLTPPDWHTRKTRAFALPLWTYWTEAARELGRVDIHVLNGDLTDGEGKKETIGLITTDIEEQAAMAAECARVFKADHRYVLYGTPFHTVSTLSHENLVASDLGCDIYETLRLKVRGVRMNVRHVVGRSDIPYGQLTQIFKEVVREELLSLVERYDAADVIARSHVHYDFEVRHRNKRAFTTPCMQLPNPDKDGHIFARKLLTQYYDVGAGTLITISKDGEVRTRPLLMDLRLAIRREYLCPVKE